MPAPTSKRRTLNILNQLKASRAPEALAEAPDEAAPELEAAAMSPAPEAAPAAPQLPPPPGAAAFMPPAEQPGRDVPTEAVAANRKRMGAPQKPGPEKTTAPKAPPKPGMKWAYEMGTWKEIPDPDLGTTPPTQINGAY